MRASAESTRRASALAVLSVALAFAIACDNGDALNNPDGSFGTGPGSYPRDAGMDGATVDMDAAVSDNGPLVDVRFVHAIPNTGPLLVCHDPDGPGPMPPRPLGGANALLRAEFGARSAALRIPALSRGELTLQRVASADAGAGDAGAADGGVEDDCGEATRESTIPLPITGQWLSPRAPLSAEDFAELGLLSTFAEASSLTLLGTGVALSEATLAARAAQAHAEALANAPGDEAGAELAAERERSTLAATFGARAWLQADIAAERADRFSLSVLHAVVDVPPAEDVAVESAVGALRVCVTAGAVDQGPLPRAPADGVPFRVRSELGSDFDPKLNYEFRAYAAADFDARRQDCASTSLSPVARGSYAGFAAGQSYTLAVIGAVAPSALCSAHQASLVRPTCSPRAAELSARIEVLAD